MLACAGLTAWTALDALPESSRTGSALLQGWMTSAIDKTNLADSRQALAV